MPAPFLKHPKGIRDIAEWYISTKTRRDYVWAVFEKQCEYALQNLESLINLFGDTVQVALLDRDGLRHPTRAVYLRGRISRPLPAFPQAT